MTILLMTTAIIVGSAISFGAKVTKNASPIGSVPMEWAWQLFRL